MRHRLSLAALVVSLSAAPAAAQLDPEPRTPYLWRVVLKAPPHPLLSNAFRGQLKRDISAALEPALGQLGTVEVIDTADLPRDKWDPLWQQFDDKGFAALDAPRDLTGVKTHFLTLDYRDGQYHLEARQHDGFTGLASPVVRRQTVRAPEMVGRTAGLMLYRDFGLVGTIEVPLAPKEELRVVVRGGELGPLDRFVKAGDVFAVAQVTKTSRPAPPPARTATGKIIAPAGGGQQPALTAKPRDFTLLRVIEAKDGTLRCAVLTRYQNPVPMTGGAVGYRCMKLGTVESPLSVRLVTKDPAYQRSVGLVNVRATEAGFGAAPEARDLLAFKDDGLFHSSRPLANVACVTVSLGPTQTKQFPVPVLGPEPVTLPFEVNPKLEEEAAHMRTLVAAASRIADARNAQTICFDATAKLIEKQKNAEALARAKGGFNAAAETDKQLTDEIARLREQPGGHPEVAKILGSIENQLKALRAFNAELEKYVKTLEEVVKRENDPTIAAKEVQGNELQRRIVLLLGQGEIEQALAAYDQLVTLVPDDAKIKAERDKLKAEWATKSEAHKKARDYLLKTWPAIATIADFKESLPRIEAAVDECKKNGDRHALRKLLTIFRGSLVKLNELAAGLDSNSDADRKSLEDATKVGEAMAALEAKINEFVNPGKE
jgi:hypothetical protein